MVLWYLERSHLHKGCGLLASKPHPASCPEPSAFVPTETYRDLQRDQSVRVPRSPVAGYGGFGSAGMLHP